MKRFSALCGMAWLLAMTALSAAAIPSPVAPDQWHDFPVSQAPGFPGVMAADGLLDKPAGKNGAIVVKDGHFYTSLVGGKRIRFLGVNFCFSACFPKHEEADLVAGRLARLGINAVRFHHMDSAPFPNGIFKQGDSRLEVLDPVALDRLDYFIAALKKQGVYADLNLHVSRWYTRAHQMAGADKTPDFDKIIDLFDPPLIDAQKDYARDLLTHVNAYTKNAYNDEPDICMVEINNENTFYTWGGQEKIAHLPEPYAGVLRGLWNDWLAAKYGSRARLAAAWNVGAMELGKDVLQDSVLQTPAKAGSPWTLEQHEGAVMTAIVGAPDKGTELHIEKVTPTSWHLQFKQAKLAVKKGQFYTVKFRGSADPPRQIQVNMGQDHADYQGLGLSANVALTREMKDFELHFVAAADDDDARMAFVVGQNTGSVTLAGVVMAPGGRTGLAAEEDPTIGSVNPGGVGAGGTPRRHRDWFDFLQHEDQAYFTEMYRFLRQDLHLHAPITGTIGMGALGTMSQAKMDYVDAHAYWDHPQFPGRPWDPNNWKIHNLPMVDAPDTSTFGGLAAIRVWGKPFTVTEYNEAMPNEWQAECVPMIATFAALQDWDALYIFAYSHNSELRKDFADNYFDIKANPAKLCFMPAAARIFESGSVLPLPEGLPVYVARDRSLEEASTYYFQLWRQLQADAGVTPDSLLKKRLSISFTPVTGTLPAGSDRRVSWTAAGAGSGQFSFHDPAASAFAGFLRPGQKVTLGPVELSNVSVPFLCATLVPADGKTSLANASQLLLTVMARTQNTGMQWKPRRSSVGTHWGKAPTRIEMVRATLGAPGWQTVAVDHDGKICPQGEMKAVQGKTELAGETCWYLLRRK